MFQLEMNTGLQFELDESKSLVSELEGTRDQLMLSRDVARDEAARSHDQLNQVTEKMEEEKRAIEFNQTQLTEQVEIKRIFTVHK